MFGAWSVLGASSWSKCTQQARLCNIPTSVMRTFQIPIAAMTGSTNIKQISVLILLCDTPEVFSVP